MPNIESLGNYLELQMHALLSNNPEPSEPAMTVFTDRDVEKLIAEIARMDPDQYKAFAWMWLDMDPMFGSANVTVRLCQAWLADPEAVYAVVGTDFWQHMKAMALEIFEPQEIEQHDPRDERKYDD